MTRRWMWLAVAVSTLLCAVGTVLVFVAAVAGFALLFISFCVFSAVPFLAFGLLGSGNPDTVPAPVADEGAASESGFLARTAARPQTSPAQPPARRRRR